MLTLALVLTATNTIYRHARDAARKRNVDTDLVTDFKQAEVEGDFLVYQGKKLPQTRPARVGTVRRRAILASHETTVTYTIVLPDEPVLEFTYGMVFRRDRQADTRAESVVFKVRLERDQAAPVTLFEKTVDIGRGEGETWTPVRLDPLSIDPAYYTPLEAAYVNHFSVGKRLLSFGLLAWFFLLLIPLVLFTHIRRQQSAPTHELILCFPS